MTELRKAAEMALEALESVYGKGQRCEAAINALRQALAQPDLARVGEVGAWGEKPPVKTYCGGKPNYCTPEVTPEEWVGLTDEEIYDYADKFLYQHGSNYGIRSFGKAVEAKLKEKNT